MWRLLGFAVLYVNGLLPSPVCGYFPALLLRLVEQPSSLCVANDASVPKLQPITGLLALIALAAVPTMLVSIANAMLSVFT